MTKTKTLVHLKREIEKVNKAIDLKIVLGQDWTKERRKHLDLLYAIRDISEGIYA